MICGGMGNDSEAGDDTAMVTIKNTEQIVVIETVGRQEREGHA